MEEFEIKNGMLIYNKDNSETSVLTMEEIDKLIDNFIKSKDAKKATILLNYKSSLYTDSEENMRKRK